MRTIRWQPDDAPTYAEGFSHGLIRQHFNLTALHGEREYLRHGFLVDVDGDGTPEIITRTRNSNRARCMRADDASTVWLSPDLVPPPDESVQISDIAVGDLDDDGIAEVLLATYQGDVICLNARDGSVRWHRRLPYLLNNSMLAASRITPGPGKNIALTVAETADKAGPGPRYRYNRMQNPSLMVLDHLGEIAFMVENYAEHNSAGHYTWTFDIDGDGFCEIGCCGEEELIWFDNDGTRLFALPCPGEGGHPDDVRVCDWVPDLPGREIIYLDGIEGVRIFSSRGEPLRRATFSRDVASHLQLIMPLPRPEGPALVGANIRAADSKLLLMDHDLEVLWGLELGPDVMMPMHVDWDGDGREEIVTGSIGRDVHNRTGAEHCSFQIIRQDGSPLYWHRFEGYTQCTPLAIGDIDRDGRPEILVSIGDHDGPEGRWSLPQDSEEHLLIIGV
jgi:hypothetical protein